MIIEMKHQALKQEFNSEPELLDIYDEYDEFTPSDREMRDYEKILDDLYDKNDSDPEWKKESFS